MKKLFLIFELFIFTASVGQNLSFQDQSFPKAEHNSFAGELPKNTGRVLVTAAFTSVHAFALPPFMAGDFARGVIEGRNPRKIQKILGIFTEIGVAIVVIGGEYAALSCPQGRIVYVSLVGIVTAIRCLKSKTLFKQSIHDSFEDNQKIVVEDAMEACHDIGINVTGNIH